MKFNLSSMKAKMLTATGILMTGNSLMAGFVESEINVTAGESVIKTLIANSTMVSVVVQSAIIFGILFSIFKIGQGLLDGQGDGGKQVWGKLGAIVAFGALYYYLFVA